MLGEQFVKEHASAYDYSCAGIAWVLVIFA